MGLLVDGKWYDRWYDTEKNDGRFIREESQFRNWITKDGSKGPTGKLDLKQSRAGIICMFRMRAHGQIVQ